MNFRPYYTTAKYKNTTTLERNVRLASSKSSIPAISYLMFCEDF